MSRRGEGAATATTKSVRDKRSAPRPSPPHDRHRVGRHVGRMAAGVSASAERCGQCAQTRATSAFVSAATLLTMVDVLLPQVLARIIFLKGLHLHIGPLKQRTGPHRGRVAGTFSRTHLLAALPPVGALHTSSWSKWYSTASVPRPMTLPHCLQTQAGKVASSGRGGRASCRRRRTIVCPCLTR